MASRSMRRRYIGSSSAFTLAACLALGAGAARAEASEPEGAPPSEGPSIAEIVVTAERREQNLQQVAVAATGFTGAELDRKGIVGAEGLQFSTPSLSVSSYGQGNKFNIRGIGRQEQEVNFATGVVTYRDGVATFTGFFQNAPYYDIANVAVFRGPQGTFAGQNATGGAVFITTNSPTLDDTGGDVQAQIGNYGQYQLRAAVNLPVNETLAVRVALNTEVRDSFFKFSTPPIGDPDPGHLRSLNLRLGLLWKPNDNFQLLWKTDLNDIETGGLPASAIPAGGVAGRPLRNLFDIGNNAYNEGQDRFIQSSAEMKYTFGNGVVLRSLTGAQYGETRARLDYDGTATDNQAFANHGHDRIYSQELTLLSPEEGRLRWIVGAYYQRDDTHLPLGDGFVLNLGPPLFLNLAAEINIHQKDAAAFGQVSYDLTPSLELQVGLRYNKHTSRQRNYTITRIPAIGAELINDFGGGQKDDKVTGKVALNWKPSDDNLLYAFIATGHKSGGVNTSPGVPASFGPEDVTDYEVGWKSTLMDGRAQVQLGAFYNRYSNFQFKLHDPAAANGLGADYGANMPGDVIIKGFEVQAQAVLGSWRLDAGVGYADSELPNVQAIDPRFPAAGAQNLSGRPAPYAPKWTANLGIQYAIDLGGGTLTPRLDYSHTAKQYTTAFENPITDVLLDRSLLNGQVSYVIGDWNAAIFGTNLTDERYNAAIQINNLRYPGPPRQFGIRVGRRF